MSASLCQSSIDKKFDTSCFHLTSVLSKFQKFKLFLYSHLDYKSNKDTSGDYERLWNTFKACLDLFEGHMKKSLELEKAFPIHEG